MKIYCDGATDRCCYIIEGQAPVVNVFPKTTNNVGEYQAVILALEEAKRLKLEQVEVLTDSLLVVNQVSGEWKCRMKHLLPLRDKVRELLQEISSNGVSVGLHWIPRGENIAGFLLE